MSLRRLCLLAEPELRQVKRAFSSLMPLDGCLDVRLRAVVADVLAHPGSLARAQLAYGLGVREGRPAGRRDGRRGLDPERALKLGVAVEYFHSASLIFDDMPSMDDATERRGRPCPHVAYGEAAATLGALSLITRAYALLWEAIGASAQAAALVDECLGVAGILDGQARDVHFRKQAERTGIEEIVEVEAAKTVPLVRLAMVLPAIVAGEGAETLERLERLASAWGLAYQILDDFKDRLMSPEESGKTAGRDDGLGRPSLPALAGPRRALARLRRLLAEARSIVDALSSEESERWEPLESLQAFLEEEAREVPRRLAMVEQEAA